MYILQYILFAICMKGREAMQKAVTIRVDEDMHKECRKKLLDDGKTFTDLVKRAMELYLKGELKISEK